MRAGRLRHRVAIQQRIESTSDLGTPIGAWETVATVWGAVEPITGREQIIGNQAANESTHQVVVRTPRLPLVLDPAVHRLEHKGRVFDINAAMDRDERGIETRMLCSEGQKVGAR